MADRMRGLMKRSNSKLSISKGSVNHIGTTPYRFRLDIFISYVDNIKNAAEVCVTWERRGKQQATTVVGVKESKAIFRQTLSMDSTLFRKQSKARDGGDSEEMKFDEKKAKFFLRKGAVDGKAVGKISLNLAHYIKGPTSTVFADMKLSNGSTIVTKIEATMIQMPKKKKNGSRAGSDAYSEMTDVNSNENDSIFGDDDADLGDLEIEATSSPAKAGSSASSGLLISPLSSAPSRSSTEKSESSEKEKSVQQNSLKKGQSSLGRGNGKSPVAAVKEEEMKQSPSLRNKLKSRMKDKKSGKKEKEVEVDNIEDLGSGVTKMRKSAFSVESSEVKELKMCVESLKRENEKLRKSKQAAMEEIDALRADLEACETTLEDMTAEQGGPASNGPTSNPKSAEMITVMRQKDRRIAELEAQNESLLDELEENHAEAVQTASMGVETGGQISRLKKKIEDLETSLRREPQFLDVVNELKVTKVSLALANMEKEQAHFALQTARARFESEYSD